MDLGKSKYHKWNVPVILGKYPISIFIKKKRKYFQEFYIYCRAPNDCVQYFTGSSGEVKSFNFDGGIQLRDIQYTICIRRELGFCGIQYIVQDNTTPDSYDLSDASANANVRINLDI